MKKLDDGFLPMHEEDIEVMVKERDARNEWWRLLKILRNEYNDIIDQLEGQFDIDGFDAFVENNFGVKMQYDNQGNVTGNYAVVDKNKYLILLMKHGT